MHLTAARLLGALPRAIGRAIVAVPHQHAPVHVIDQAAAIIFVAREADRLDATLTCTDLGPTLVTTPEHNGALPARQAQPPWWRRGGRARGSR